MSNTIGFTNFRKFTNFPEINLGDITILVGGNNAGKSTLVKAMLLMRDFLKSRINSNDIVNYNYGIFSPQFVFDTEHVNVGDFYRAFCRQSPLSEDTISFVMAIDKYRFVVNISGERKPGIIPMISKIEISSFDKGKDVSFIFDFSKSKMIIHFEYDKEALKSYKYTMHEHKIQLDALKDKLSKSRDLNEISSLKMKIEQQEKIIKANNATYDISEYDEVTVPLFYSFDNSIGKMLLPELINGFVYYADSQTIGDKRAAHYKKGVADKNFLKGKVEDILLISAELEKTLNQQDIEYIYAHSVAQKLFYADCIESRSNDYTKRTIHDFYNAKIAIDDEEFYFIERWLKDFNIGNSLKVIPYNGDNYRVVIFDNDNPEVRDLRKSSYPGGIDLADKGMGSIQLVVLLLRIATFIRKHKYSRFTILLEEPEQNLHPALQSKLADFLYEVYLKFEVRFMIETHSEYLIRHIQVLAAKFFKNNQADSPFEVLYLTGDKKQPCYNMGFQKNGKFEKEFGPGFFNVADDAAMELFDLNEED